MTQVTEPTQAQTAVMRWQEAMPEDLLADAAMVVATGYYPTLKSVAQAGFKMRVAEMLGFSRIEGLQYIHVIEPKAGSERPPAIVIGYPLVAARIQRSGNFDYRVEEKSSERCEIAFYRLGMGRSERIGTSIFTIDDARRQGLIKSGGNWEKIPETMLFARALTNGAKTYCPSVLGGVETGDEDLFVVEGAIKDVPEKPPETTHGEQFAPDPWASFWPQAKEIGYERGKVHQFFGVGPEDGALKAKVEDAAELQDMTVPEALADMLTMLREGTNTLPLVIDQVPFDPPEVQE